ncbi:hypothetical protein AUG19_00315 [archaeon 13_1_20CM_2_54_9]|nr:MAG: hypothetical protein AUJ07_04000 [Crenarchaeota archaeon 13_1_40CM_3_53_5]OLE77496.1 MAG: hypothetical protein AUG19_00315 [archaeon 13_1_20CM_2_54_9]
MRTILPEVDQAILEAIREHVSRVPQKSILIRKSDSPPKTTPSVHIWNRAFTASDLSIGANAPEAGTTTEEQFDGDGKRISFKMSNPPLRPLSGVVIQPRRTLKEERDYTVDYARGILTFSEPPEKGRRNILLRYRSGKDAGEVKGLRLKLVYDLDVWATDVEEEGLIVSDIASAIMKTRETLASKGIQLRIEGGRDFSPNEGLPDGLLCKRVECTAEADMLVKIPIPRIEKIEVEQSVPQGS